MNNIHSTEEIRNIIEDWHEFYYPRMRYTKNDAQVIPSGAVTKILYNDLDYDTKSCYDLANSRFVAPFDGYYCVMASIMTNSVAWTAGNTARTGIHKNGVEVVAGLRNVVDYDITKFMYCPCQGDFYLSKNDYIEIILIHARGSDTNLYTSSLFNYFSVHRI